MAIGAESLVIVQILKQCFVTAMRDDVVSNRRELLASVRWNAGRTPRTLTDVVSALQTLLAP